MNKVVGYLAVAMVCISVCAGLRCYTCISFDVTSTNSFYEEAIQQQYPRDKDCEDGKKDELDIYTCVSPFDDACLLTDLRISGTIGNVPAAVDIVLRTCTGTVVDDRTDTCDYDLDDTAVLNPWLIEPSLDDIEDAFEQAFSVPVTLSAFYDTVCVCDKDKCNAADNLNLASPLLLLVAAIQLFMNL